MTHLQGFSMRAHPRAANSLHRWETLALQPSPSQCRTDQSGVVKRSLIPSEVPPSTVSVELYLPARWEATAS